jgi:hypothetical protein
VSCQGEKEQEMGASGMYLWMRSKLLDGWRGGVSKYPGQSTHRTRPIVLSSSDDTKIQR